jgi:hydroxyacylglutathione hydrolase
LIFEKIKSEGLAHNSYLLGSDGEAVIIDPRRDCDIYLEIARKNDLIINRIFETHRNEDYVIGSLELSNLTGAEVFHGSRLGFAYGKGVNEGNLFTLGSLELEVLETPGHTDESISILLRDENESSEVAYMIFTGDALLAGDVGRTDLSGEGEAERHAGDLYDTLFDKILPLGDGAIVCPAHGAGSICGSEISDREYTTIGYEKKTNVALQKKERRKFIDYKLDERLHRPPHFSMIEKLNIEGPPLLKEMPDPRPLTPNMLKEYEKKGAQIVDVRMPTSYAAGSIPGSYSLWRNGLPAFAGWVLNYCDPVLIVDEDNLQVANVVRYLVRLGYDRIPGYLAEGFSAWYLASEEIQRIRTWSVHDLKENMGKDSMFILDVRDKRHLERDGYMRGAHSIYVGQVGERLGEVPKDKPVIVYCDAGFKSSIAASILKKNGYRNVTNVLGGIIAWKKAGYPLETPSSPRASI